MADFRLLELPRGKTIPTTPGLYYWTEWAMVVEVYCKGRKFKEGGRLYVKIPGGIEVRVTPRIAGKFVTTLRGKDVQGQTV